MRRQGKLKLTDQRSDWWLPNLPLYLAVGPDFSSGSWSITDIIDDRAQEKLWAALSGRLKCTFLWLPKKYQNECWRLVVTNVTRYCVNQYSSHIVLNTFIMKFQDAGNDRPSIQGTFDGNSCKVDYFKPCRWQNFKTCPSITFNTKYLYF